MYTVLKYSSVPDLPGRNKQRSLSKSSGILNEQSSESIFLPPRLLIECASQAILSASVSPTLKAELWRCRPVPVNSQMPVDWSESALLILDSLCKQSTATVKSFLESFADPASPG